MSKREKMVLLTCVFTLSLFIVYDECLYSHIPDNEQVVEIESSEDITADVLANNIKDHESPEDYI